MKTLVVICIAMTVVAVSAADKWKPLWDGKTFNGWHIIGKGEWKIIDDAIRGTHKKEEQEFSHLVTDKPYRGDWASGETFHGKLHLPLEQRDK